MNQHTHGPTADPTDDDPGLDKIRDLIARSSLGTAGAVALRNRTAPELSELTRQLTALRNQLAHSTTLSSDDLVNLTLLAEQCDKLGLRDLAHWAHAELAAAHLERLAHTSELLGNHAEAATWRARAATLRQTFGS
ncbi:hypothetical protein KDN32_03775 [Nocardioides sp. J2M5]|uniref:hypothetical protein n=1 Tax=Nocardioides palaemonis TaxID=2829810 RepID=UPI001BAACE9B|nr:hypothetical protein [Nocardioides palaemonis]MBS2936861.1 hypothetical protein [Nocardioides palaemonis]